MKEEVDALMDRKQDFIQPGRLKNQHISTWTWKQLRLVFADSWTHEPPSTIQMFHLDDEHG